MESAGNTTLQKILTVARQEFLQKGYKGASLRTISKNAGVTTGALYGYFKNKQELFEALVKEEYDTFHTLYQDALSRFSQLPAQLQKERMIGYTTQVISVMTEYMYEHYDAFKLILCCSEGTKYSRLVYDLAMMDVDATHDFARMNRETGSPVRDVNANLEQMLTFGMFSTYFQLIIQDIPREEAEEYVQQLLIFYSAGWKQLMDF